MIVTPSRLLRRTVLTSMFVPGLLATGAIAQTPPPIIADGTPAANNAIGVKPGQAGGTGRYVMTPTANGFLRLDSKTGSVSLCVVKNDTVTCKSSADDRAALEAEIARLVRKNAELEKKLADASKSTAQRLREALPTEKDMDQALSFAEKFMRRMLRIMREDKQKEPQDRI